MGGLWIVLRATVSLAGPTVTLLYPLYASIQALESPRKEDDQQWLTYWMLYSFVQIFELVALNALAWIPIWPFVKLAIISWLVLPQFEGAAFVYEHIIRKHVQKLKEKSGGDFNAKTPEALASAIQENGEEALGKIKDASKSEVFESKSPEALASAIQENGDEAFGTATEVDKNRPSPTKEPQERF